MGTGLQGLLWAGILWARNSSSRPTTQLPEAGISDPDPGGLDGPSLGTQPGGRLRPHPLRQV